MPSFLTNTTNINVLDLKLTNTKAHLILRHIVLSTVFVVLDQNWQIIFSFNLEDPYVVSVYSTCLLQNEDWIIPIFNTVQALNNGVLKMSPTNKMITKYSLNNNQYYVSGCFNNSFVSGSFIIS